MGKHRSTDLKQSVIDFLNRSSTHSVYKASRVFDVPEETIRRWRSRHETEHTLENHYKRSKSYKITQAHFDFIKAYVTRHKDAYLREVREQLVNEFEGLTISLQHLSRVIKDIPYSRKLWTRHHYPKQRYGVDMDFEADKRVFFAKLKHFAMDDRLDRFR